MYIDREKDIFSCLFVCGDYTAKYMCIERLLPCECCTESRAYLSCMSEAISKCAGVKICSYELAVLFRNSKQSDCEP